MSILLNAHHLRQMRQKAADVRSNKSKKQPQGKTAAVAKANKMQKNWTFHMEGVIFDILFHKTSLAVSCNGIDIPTSHEFYDDGAVITFSLNNHVAQVKTSGNPTGGIVFTMTVDGQFVPSTDDY